MATLTVWKFDDAEGAERAEKTLLELAKQELINLQDAATVSWKEGDKTGSGDNNTTNDIAVLYPPNRKPVLMTVYFTGSKLETEQSNLVFQEIGRKLVSLYV